MLADPEGFARLQRLGPRKVPVLARGDRFIFTQSLEDVAEFVGLASSGLARLPPEALVEKWLVVLRTAQDYTRQFTPSRFEEDAVASRPRPVRVLAHHVFRVAEAFLETAVDGREYSIGAANQESPVKLDREAVARYGADIVARVEAWWGGLASEGKAGRDCRAAPATRCARPARCWRVHRRARRRHRIGGARRNRGARCAARAAPRSPAGS